MSEFNEATIFDESREQALLQGHAGELSTEEKQALDTLKAEKLVSRKEKIRIAVEVAKNSFQNAIWNEKKSPHEISGIVHRLNNLEKKLETAGEDDLKNIVAELEAINGKSGTAKAAAA